MGSSTRLRSVELPTGPTRLFCGVIVFKPSSVRPDVPLTQVVAQRPPKPPEVTYLPLIKGVTRVPLSLRLLPTRLLTVEIVPLTPVLTPTQVAAPLWPFQLGLWTT